MSTMAMAAADLASDYIQQCLGFTSLSSKIHALDRIQTSLRKCGVGDEGVSADASSGSAATTTTTSSTGADDAGTKEDWRKFLENGHHSINDSNSDLRVEDTESNYCMLRDSFIKCLVESCHFPGNVYDDMVDGEEEEDDDTQGRSSNAERLVESSFLCLSLLAGLVRYNHQHHCAEKKAGKRSEMPPIFGGEFALAIAPAAVVALRLSTNNDINEDDEYCTWNGPSRATSDLLIELLHPNRPKCEARSSASILRDSILVPASSCYSSSTRDTTTARTVSSSSLSAARVAHVLSSCVIAAVVHATSYAPPSDQIIYTTNQQQYGEDELSVREETAVLGKLQDMREVLTNVGLVCSRRLCSIGDRETCNDRCAQDILDAIQYIFDIAPFAVESQLEALLDEEAKPILDRLRRVDEEGVRNREMKADTQMFNSATTDALDISYDQLMDEEDAGGSGQGELEEAIPPLYAGIARPPILFTTIKNLDDMLLAISENLGSTDAEQWDVRLDALIDLECILAGGVICVSEDARYIFIERIRKMPWEKQFTDLRSQITQKACNVVVAVSYEYREFVVEDMQLLQAVSQFIECCIPPILMLCKSGTKLMANQGVNCIRSLFAVCGFTGFARTFPRLCEVVLDKKAAKNQKRACVIALTVALRVWDPSCSVKYLDQLTMAVKEGATNRDPVVREEGRKLYWAMVSACDETSRAVQNMFSDRSREMKNLANERESIDSEWDEDGVMSALVKTGVVEVPDKPAKAEITANKTRSAPTVGNDVPPRNSVKRPGTAAARLRAMHGTPFKAQRLGTPMKTASTTVVKSSWKRSPYTTSGTRLTTPNIDPSSALRMKLADRKSIQRGSIGTPNVTLVQSADAPLIILDEEKENLAAMAAFKYQSTPSKSSPSYESLASPMIGTPIVNLMARASPHSAEKIKNTGDILEEIVSMLSDQFSPHEQSLGIKALALFAKENPCHPSWHENFPLVLHCLLDHVKNMPTSDFNGPVDFIRSPSKNLSACHQMQHIFLQGVRSLLQFVPGHVTLQQIKDIVNCLIECTHDAPFEIVHTAERALANLFAFSDPEVCFEHLIPFTRVDIDLTSKSNPSALLSTLRTVRHLVGRVSTALLKNELPSLLPLFRNALHHKSMDMRKATVFVLVELRIVLGDELDLDGFTDCQKRLIDVYVERHPNRLQTMMG